MIYQVLDSFESLPFFTVNRTIFALFRNSKVVQWLALFCLVLCVECMFSLCLYRFLLGDIHIRLILQSRHSLTKAQIWIWSTGAIVAHCSPRDGLKSEYSFTMLYIVTTCKHRFFFR